MDRFTISLDAELARDFDALIAARGYNNRSEAVRDLIRAALGADGGPSRGTGQCVANLSYVYDHHERALAQRLAGLHHEHHDLGVAAMHSHLDHEHCMESVILRGPTEQVRRFADALMAESGVRHGQLNVVDLEATAPRHIHGPSGSQHRHFRPVR